MAASPRRRRRVLILIQGPIHQDLKGRGTRDVLGSLAALDSALRARLFVACAVWDDEPESAVREIAPLADRVIACSKPPRAGSCHRNYQTTAVTQALQALAGESFGHVLKTRSDIVLSEPFVREIVGLADQNFERVLTTTMVTLREPFHVSDMVLFSTWENIAAWFDARPVFYEDLFAPEVQFARVFVRNKGLDYPHQMAAYLRFLRDWIVLRNFAREGLIWLKVPRLSEAGLDRAIPPSERIVPTLHDRDSGPIMARPVSIGFHRFLTRTRVPLVLIACALEVGDVLSLGIIWRARALLGRVLPPRWRGPRLFAYTVDPKGAEHAKPLAGSAP